VDGKPATDSLLVDFGDIESGTSKAARWIMTCTLSGRFVELSARFSHSDELGGELTSLIDAINPHLLVHDVLVDLPGRDTVRDFLAKDGDIYRIYETDSKDTVVADVSPDASLAVDGLKGTLTIEPFPAGGMYLRLPDPFNGRLVITEVLRSDGKQIKSDNAWLSKSRNGQAWDYFINLFDVNSTGTYTLRFEDTSVVPVPPTIQSIADRTELEGNQVSFIVEASDPNGTVPTLSAAPLPVGATFADQDDGRGVFDWIPAEGQAGVYGIVFTASDGALEATRRATITIQAFIDTDGDDIDDDWERQYFGSLDRDGSGDFDSDGISDLDEFLAETDPAERADVAVRLSADNMNPSVGDELILTVTATNNGLRDATGVEIVDLLSDGLVYVTPDSGPDPDYQHSTGVWDIPTLAPDTTATLNIKAQVTRSGRILNIAALSNADLYDPDRSNNSAALLLNGGSQSDLALALTTDKLTPEAGDTITVDLTVTNNGTDDATGVEIEASVPDDLSYMSSTASQGVYNENTGIWDVGDLDSGAGAELQLTLNADTIDELILTAAISGSSQPDPDPTNNRSSIVINQDPSIHQYIADVAIYKLVNHSTVDVGGQAVFTLIVRNNGPDDAGNIEIDDLLPDGLAFQSAIPSGGNYDNENEPWQWQVQHGHH
jgi:uncharacterized repeat protein (TIGR01451 family)